MNPAFSRRGVITVVAVCVTSFVGGILLMVFAQDLAGVESNRFDAFAVSATGHQALYEILDELGIPVYRSTWESGKRAGPRGVLMMLQPGEHRPEWFIGPGRRAVDGGVAPRQAMDAAIRRARTIVYVLPKWRAGAHDSNGEWIGPPTLLGEAEVQQTLQIVGVDARIVRPANEDSLAWRTGGLGPEPALRQVQLLTSDVLDPIISTTSGQILVGETRVNSESDEFDDRNRLIVISDPDLLANHGLAHTGNAILTVQLIESLRRGGAVVLDETCHGHIIEPSFWREVFRFPLALIMLHMVFCVLVLLWVGMGRFGSPRRPPPEIAPGNRFLIRNTAELLRYGGHTAAMLRRYVTHAVQDVKAQLHAPSGMNREQLTAWFDRVERSRRTTLHYRDVMAGVAPLTESSDPPAERVLRAARRVFDWQQEILNGPAGR